MAEPSLEFLGKQIERLQVEMRHARAEIAALRNRIDANEVRIEEVVLLLNEMREYMEARLPRWKSRSTLASRKFTRPWRIISRCCSPLSRPRSSRPSSIQRNARVAH